MHGAIDDVRIYRSVLTRSEVANLAGAGFTTNSPPTVSLSAPANGATYRAGSTISVSATASDVGGTIARVRFYADSTLIGADTSSPYSVSWPNVAAGSYVLKAVATDNDGVSTTSARIWGRSSWRSERLSRKQIPQAAMPQATKSTPKGT